MKTQRSFRLNSDEDELLDRRITEIAQWGRQGELIRLILWRGLMWDHELPETLHGLDALTPTPPPEVIEVEVERVVEKIVQVAAPQAGMPDEQREFYAAMVAELRAVRQPAQTQAPPAQREVHSGGLDMRERPRKANHPKAEPGPDTQH